MTTCQPPNLKNGCLALGFVLVCEAIVPPVARAQRFQLTPSVGITQVYDSNLFFTSSDRQADSIWRVTPTVEWSHRSDPWTLIGHFTLDAERYTDHPELNTPQAREHAMITLRYRPTPRFTVGSATEFSKTQMAGELNAETALLLARAHAWRVSVHPSAAYRLDARTEGTMDYSYSEDRIDMAGGIRTRAQSAAVGVKRHLSSRDTASVGYGFRQFSFGPEDVSSSHVLTAGWSHFITPLASLTLHGGPRVSDRVVAPELSASFRYQPRFADLAFTYSRGQTTIIGLAGPVDTHSFTATAIYKPRPSLHVQLTPGVFRSAHRGTAVQVYRMSFETRHPMTRWLALDASYDLNVQRGDIYALRPQDRISRHVALVRLIAAPPPAGPKRN